VNVGARNDAHSRPSSQTHVHGSRPRGGPQLPVRPAPSGRDRHRDDPTRGKSRHRTRDRKRRHSPLVECIHPSARWGARGLPGRDAGTDWDRTNPLELRPDGRQRARVMGRFLALRAVWAGPNRHHGPQSSPLPSCRSRLSRSAQARGGRPGARVLTRPVWKRAPDLSAHGLSPLALRHRAQLRALAVNRLFDIHART
jgi:hypothetical protein